MGWLNKSPLRMAAACLSSGNLNTGELSANRGGARKAGAWSGAIAMTVFGQPGTLSSGGSALIFSGAGRLNTFQALWPAGVALAGNGFAGLMSGQAIVAYDSAITARSGLLTDATIAESGRAPLFAWQAAVQISGAMINGAGYNPITLEVPFTSGLCVMALSGAPGFIVTFTPEVVPVGPLGNML